MRIGWRNFGTETVFRCGFNRRDIYDYPEHLHQFAEIVYLKEGLLELTVEGTTEIMHSGDCAIIPPYHAHSYHTPEYARRWIAVFSDDFIPPFVSNEEFFSSPDKYVFHLDEKFLKLLIEIFPDNREKWIQATTAEVRNMHLVTACIYENYLRVANLSITNKNKALSNILLYIHHHYLENLTLSSVGKALGYSPKYVSNCISSIKNYNFALLINSLRIDHAKSLLVKTNEKIITIAGICGFNNEQSFHRSFRSLTGITPREYRIQKRHRTN